MLEMLRKAELFLELVAYVHREEGMCEDRGRRAQRAQPMQKGAPSWQKLRNSRHKEKHADRVTATVEAIRLHLGDPQFYGFTGLTAFLAESFPS